MRKLVLCAVVALVPGFAFAAADGTNGSASTDTHVTGTEVKSDATAKSDAKDTAVKADVKADAAAKSKGVRHGAGKAKVKTDTKSGTENPSKS